MLHVTGVKEGDECGSRCLKLIGIASRVQEIYDSPKCIIYIPKYFFYFGILTHKKNTVLKKQKKTHIIII